MFSNKNTISIQGTVGKDPYVLNNSYGKACITSICWTKGYKDKNTGKFVRVKDVWFKIFLKEDAADLQFRKGDRLEVTGYLDLEEWEDKNTGQKREGMKIVSTEAIVIPRRDNQIEQAPF